MEIRRKVFSAIEDEDGEVRLYSTVDVDSYNYNDDYDYVESLYSDAYVDGYEYAQREFAEKKEKFHEVSGSHRGYGTAMMHDAVGLGSHNTLGRFVGMRAANKASREGASDEDIVRRGKNAASVASLAADTAGLGAGAGMLALANRQLKKDYGYGLADGIKDGYKEAYKKVLKKHGRSAADALSGARKFVKNHKVGVAAGIGALAAGQLAMNAGLARHAADYGIRVKMDKRDSDNKKKNI